MRSYYIDDIFDHDQTRLRDYLASQGWADVLDGLYWLELPPDILSAEQLAHAMECGPHACALECQDNWVRMELLIRSRRKLRCSCVAYADDCQRGYMMDRLDAIFSTLGIKA